MTVRELRKNLRATLDSGKITVVKPSYGPVRAFIVSVPQHDHWNAKAKSAALRAAKKNFLATLKAEA
jgi:hypothetical protein